MKSFLILILFILIISFVNTLLNKKVFNKTEKNNNVNNQYVKKDLMTDYERYFYNVLRELELEFNIKIHPQINLASIIKKETNNHYINELFRNIDFAIFDENYDELLLLIEINDSTHNSLKRISRDKKVDKIVTNAGFKLIKFYSNYPNKKDYIKTRIKKEIENLIEEKK